MTASFKLDELQMTDTHPTDEPNSILDEAPLRCQEPGCGNQLTYGGRGRKPKYCDEHKPAAQKRNTLPKTVRDFDAKSVEESLVQYFSVLGWGVALINPLDGKIIASGGPAVAHELVELAKRKKELAKILKRIAMPGEYGPLVIAASAILIPIAANHNLIPQMVFTPPSPSTSNEGR